LNTRLVYASQFNPKEGKTERLLDLCKKLQADKYLSGRFGKKYLDEKKFAKNNIEIAYQDFQHPFYPQLYGEFVPNLSTIDLLFNCGDESLNIINTTKKKL
jgi:hypothetical protein